MPVVQYFQSSAAYHEGDYARSLAHAEKALAAQPDDDDPFGRAFHLARNLNRQSERAIDLAVLLSLLGESLTAQRRFAEAETALLEAYETQQARVLPQQAGLVETRRRLAALYESWGRPDRAAAYGAKM